VSAFVKRSTKEGARGRLLARDSRTSPDPSLGRRGTLNERFIWQLRKSIGHQETGLLELAQLLDHPLTVADVIDETAGTRSLVLEIPPPLAARFAYAAGQFCTFRATIGGEPIVRCYSMSSSPPMGDPFTVTVKRVPGGKMSNWMNDTLAPGDAVDVVPPAGRFVLRAVETPIVAFAAGSGITPVLSIIKTALVTTAREIALVYANRGPDSVIFADAVERLRAGFGGRLSVHHHLDSENGFLDAAACAALVGERAQADFYVCGPGPYMEVVETGLARRGVDASRLFIVRFELSDEAPASLKSETETIVIRLEGRRHRVRYEPGDSILNAARRAGLKPPFNCQAGNCGTCMAYLDPRATPGWGPGP
jgi:3-ketosteroid 9alpha-monooxygenase subunit B